MTEIMITCGKCDPDKIKDIVSERTVVIFEGQTEVWACKHVKSFKATHPLKYVPVK